MKENSIADEPDRDLVKFRNDLGTVRFLAAAPGR
jgi:hypothetical protein